MSSVMIQNPATGHVIDIQENSTVDGAVLDAFHPKTSPGESSANQQWVFVIDQSGSGYYYIQNPLTQHVIDIQGNSTADGAVLDAFHMKNAPGENHANQLWQFVPDPAGSGYYFIQNLLTGNVIDILGDSTSDGAALDAYPMKLFGYENQLWTPLGGNFPAAVEMLPPGGGLVSSNNYFLWLGSCPSPANLTGLTLNMDVAYDLLSTDGFSLQWNGWGPSGANVVLQQYMVRVTNGGVMKYALEIWPSPSYTEVDGYQIVSGSGSLGIAYTVGILTTLPTPTLTAGHTITIELLYNGDTVAGAQFTLSYNGSQVAQSPQILLQDQSVNLVPGSPTINVPLSGMDPIVGFQVALVGYDGGATANFVSGQGKITVTSPTPLVPLANRPACISDQNTNTGESSNMIYSLLPVSPSTTMVQSFAVPEPTIINIQGFGDFAVTGSGFVPNDQLILSYVLSGGGSGFSEGDAGNPITFAAAADGSFSCVVQPPNYPGPEFAAGTVSSFSVTVRDQHNDTAMASCQVNGEGRIVNFQRG